MVRQTHGNLLDAVLGTDLDLTQLLARDRTVFRPMDTYNEDLDFLDADRLAPADELDIANVVTIGEETSNSFYDEEPCSTECLSSADGLLSGDSTCSSTIFQFPPSSTSQYQEPSEYVLQEIENFDYPITPLIKEEVKMKIKLRRLAEGKEDISVEFKEPEPEKLTEEEEERRRERRHKNKLAAQKCRSKKRKLAEHLEGETELLENKQDSLIQEIERLQQEKEHLEEIVKIHSSVCPKMRCISFS